MIMNSTSLVNLLRFARALGPLRGIVSYLKMHALRSGLAEVRLPNGEATVFVRRGSADVEVFDQIFVMRDYDLRRFRHWKRINEKRQQIIASGSTPLVVDCGANIGLSALYLSQLFPDTSIAAIEPESGNFSVLQRNVAWNPHIRPLNAAISDRAGFVSIANPNASNWAFRVSEVSVDGSAAIPTMTIDQVRAMASDHRLLAVKVDIESAEEQLFRSNTDWLNETPLLIIELHDWMLPWAGSSHTFFCALQGKQFDFLLAGENALVFNWACFS